MDTMAAKKPLTSGEAQAQSLCLPEMCTIQGFRSQGPLTIQVP